MDLRRSDLFAFAPNSTTVEAEEEYGNDWNQRRGGPVVAAEEGYGNWDPRRGGSVLDAEEKFSLSDEDEDFGDDDGDDDFGDDAFGGDDVDSQLDQILSQMDHEEGFGADPLSIPPSLEGHRDELANIIRDGVRNAFFGESEGVQSMFRSGAEWVSNKFEQMAMPGDVEEIAQALMADGSLCNWNELSDSDRQAAVHAAIWYSMWPGVELSADDEFWKAWSTGSLSSIPTDAFNIAKAALTGDLPKMVYASLAENPVIGNVMQSAGWDPKNADQMKNERAMTLWVLGKFGFPVDAYIARAITDQGQGVIAACQQASAGPTAVGPAEEAMVEELVVPTQELADTGFGLPTPEQILAGGYGFAILGSLAGIFS